MYIHGCLPVGEKVITAPPGKETGNGREAPLCPLLSADRPQGGALGDPWSERADRRARAVRGDIARRWRWGAGPVSRRGAAGPVPRRRSWCRLRAGGLRPGRNARRRGAAPVTLRSAIRSPEARAHDGDDVFGSGRLCHRDSHQPPGTVGAGRTPSRAGIATDHPARHRAGYRRGSRPMRPVALDAIYRIPPSRPAGSGSKTLV